MLRKSGAVFDVKLGCWYEQTKLTSALSHVRQARVYVRAQALSSALRLHPMHSAWKSLRLWNWFWTGFKPEAISDSEYTKDTQISTAVHPPLHLNAWASFYYIPICNPNQTKYSAEYNYSQGSQTELKHRVWPNVKNLISIWNTPNVNPLIHDYCGIFDHLPDLSALRS